MRDYWYHIKARFYSFFSRRLTIHTLRSDPDWDKGETILHAAFQLLVDYVDQELSEYPVDPKLNPHHQELQSLYHWWTVERPSRITLEQRLEGIQIPPVAEMFAEITEGKFTGCHKLIHPYDKYSDFYAALDAEGDAEEKFFEEDQRNLHRLIDVRRYMWT